MTVEMSIIGSLCLISSTSKSPDGEAIRQHGFFYGWTALTLVNQFRQYTILFLSFMSWVLVKLVLQYLKHSETGTALNIKFFEKKLYSFYLGISYINLPDVSLLRKEIVP